MTNTDTAPAAIHPYFIDKAAKIFRDAGGDPANSAPLAAWAAAHRPGNDQWLRVIVAADGRILAEARYVPGRVGASYITRVMYDRDRDLIGREMQLTRGTLGRRAETTAIVVTFSQACLGAGPRS